MIQFPYHLSHTDDLLEIPPVLEDMRDEPELRGISLNLTEQCYITS